MPSIAALCSNLLRGDTPPGFSTAQIVAAQWTPGGATRVLWVAHPGMNALRTPTP